MRTAWLLLTLGLCLPLNARPQGVDDVSLQIWVDYNPSFSITPRLDLYGDLGVRRELESGGWWRIVARPSIRYFASDHLWFGGGLGSFYTFNEIIEDRWEIRPWQGVNLIWPRGRASVEHFVRLEEQFDFNTATWESNVSIRARYAAIASYQWAARFQQERYWRVNASGEIFVVLAGEQGQSREQMRAAVGIERSFGWSSSLQIETVWQKRGLFILSDEDVDDIFIRVRVFQGWMN